MAQFSANLSILWTELDVYDRFRAASEAGFRFVEIGVIDGLDHDRIRHEIDEYGQTLVLFNPSTGDPSRRELGLVALPGREEEFGRIMEGAIHRARRLGARRLNALLGAVHGVSKESARDTAIRNLSMAARLADPAGVTVLVEPVNTVDLPGYFAPTTREAADLITEVNVPNVRMLFDVYHSAQMNEDPIDSLCRYFSLIDHIHIADFPGRHEPGTGWQKLSEFVSECVRLGYQGFIGLEYQPSRDTVSSLSWLDAYPGWRTVGAVG
jgi:hydroxypyruvate isomerase